jgi:5-methyltetrahydropteroyltriglutamate--homocysteine methyltransferase
VDDWKAAAAASPVPVKAVLTGPYTLAALSESGGEDGSPLVHDLAVALGQEVEALVKAGARDVQIDEPALVLRKTLPAGYGAAAASLLRGKGAARMWLFTYFGGVGHLLDEILALPFDGLGFDLVQGASTAAALRGRRIEKPVALGLVDARNTKLEDPRAVAEQVLAFRDAVPLDRSYVSPSNGLEFLPRRQAKEKLRVLAAAARIANGGTT